MSEQIRIAILGYGNLGRGVETCIAKNRDMRLVGIATRRDPGSLEVASDTTVLSLHDLNTQGDEIDVLILCGGSKDDLPEQGPHYAARFNTVDSFDTHARIPEYFAAVDAAAREGGTTALISAGWDPGMFSIARLYGEALLPDGDTYTFWGRGLSQGHSDAIRRVPGVAAGVQYTIPSEDAIARVRSGERPDLGTRERHTRECFVVLEDGADPDAVREAIVTMSDYFADYDTTVRFIDADTLHRDHAAMPHGGFVIRSGSTSPQHNQVVEYAIKLDSNPEFTASALLAYARAVHRLSVQGHVGAITPLDVAPALLSPARGEDLRRDLL